MTSKPKVHLVVPDSHAKPGVSNRRADWLGCLIRDLKPDVVVNLGDGADMESLCSYDRGTKSFHGKNYEKDIEAHLDFQERMWGPIKKQKRKLPERHYLIGNHEHRITRAIQLQPELEGDRFGVSMKDLDLKKYYDEVHDYTGGTPGVKVIDGIAYAHFFISGVKGLPISGENIGSSLLSKHHHSCTCGHIHTLDWANRTTVQGKRINGLAAGVFQEHWSSYAGEANRLWWPGVVIKWDVDGQGNYDPEFVSMKRIQREYSKK